MSKLKSDKDVFAKNIALKRFENQIDIIVFVAHYTIKIHTNSIMHNINSHS
jgi:hypothetical protein